MIHRYRCGCGCGCGGEQTYRPDCRDSRGNPIVLHPLTQPMLDLSDPPTPGHRDIRCFRDLWISIRGQASRKSFQNSHDYPVQRCPSDTRYHAAVGQQSAQAFDLHCAKLN
jgi:hypothetical protein